MLIVGDTEKFVMHFVSKAWTFFFSQQVGSVFTAIEEDGGDKRLVELELTCEADSVAPPDPV